jgi:hypothetical protein
MRPRRIASDWRASDVRPDKGSRVHNTKHNTSRGSPRPAKRPNEVVDLAANFRSLESLKARMRCAPGHEPSLPRLPHQASPLQPAVAQCADVARVVMDGALRHGQSHRSGLGRRIVRRAAVKMSESGCVGLACLGSPSPHATFEICVLGHCHGLSRSGWSSPATTSETIGPRQRPETESPFASVQDRAGDGL